MIINNVNLRKVYNKTKIKIKNTVDDKRKVEQLKKEMTVINDIDKYLKSYINWKE